MTREAMFTAKMTAFSAWIRENCMEASSGLAVTNLDFILRRFDDPANQRIMLIEEKMNWSLLTRSQARTFQLLDTVLTIYSLAHSLNYLGFYLVQFQNSSPEDSEWIAINTKRATPDQLRLHLNMDQLHTARAGGGVAWGDLTQPTFGHG